MSVGKRKTFEYVVSRALQKQHQKPYLCKPTLVAVGDSMYSKLDSRSVDMAGSIPSLCGIDTDNFT